MYVYIYSIYKYVLLSINIICLQRKKIKQFKNSFKVKVTVCGFFLFVRRKLHKKNIIKYLNRNSV